MNLGFRDKRCSVNWRQFFEIFFGDSNSSYFAYLRSTPIKNLIRFGTYRPIENPQARQSKRLPHIVRDIKSKLQIAWIGKLRLGQRILTLILKGEVSALLTSLPLLVRNQLYHFNLKTTYLVQTSKYKEVSRRNNTSTFRTKVSVPS